MRVTGLTATATRYNGYWLGGVTIQVQNATSQRVAGALVRGSFSPAAGSFSCTTSSAGTCSVLTGHLSNGNNKVLLFTVDAVTAPSLVYDPAGSITTVSLRRPTGRP